MEKWKSKYEVQRVTANRSWFLRISQVLLSTYFSTCLFFHFSTLTSVTLTSVTS